ncbi:abortive infection family protein [Thiomicrorhabdus sp.]|uniref:abortive infection family protein n=1 Tax=Thiomicrorhabdus sp. TaxID=2039724 RepID=UPI00356AC412
MAGSSPATKSLSDYFKAGDFGSVEAEFKRAISQIDRDPHAAITAASSIIEALCKTYIETNELDMPSKQTIVPLWRAVKQHLGLNSNQTLAEDQNRILQGLSSIVDGIGAYRTHIGSAHGRGLQPPSIRPHEARLSMCFAFYLQVNLFKG